QVRDRRLRVEEDPSQPRIGQSTRREDCLTDETLPRSPGQLEELAPVQCCSRRGQQEAGLRRAGQEDPRDKAPHTGDVRKVLECPQKIRHYAIAELPRERENNAGGPEGAGPEAWRGSKQAVQRSYTGLRE